MPVLTESLLRSASSPESFARGEDYYQSGAVFDTYRQKDTLFGKCHGKANARYRIRVDLDQQGIRSVSCTCPYELEGFCKHITALLLMFIRQPEAFELRSSPEDLLASLSREELLSLFHDLLKRYPDLQVWLETTSLPWRFKGDASSEDQDQKTEQVYRRQVRTILHSLDQMTASEAYWALSDMVTDLDQIAAAACDLLESGDGKAALSILMVILEETSNEYDMFDDSNGELGFFLGDLGLPLAEAFLSSTLEENEIEAIYQRLESINTRLEKYEIQGLEVALSATRHGWQPVESTEIDEAKLNILERQGRTDDYLDLCRQSGNYLRLTMKLIDLGRTDEAVEQAMVHVASAGDALVISERLLAIHRPEAAVIVAERGLTLPGFKFNLGAWLGPLEEVQGRNVEASAAYRAAFDEVPSLALYKAIQNLAGLDWPAIKPELTNRLQSAGRSESLVDVLLYEHDWDAAIKVADHESWNYHLVEQVVEAVTPARPDWATKACRLQAEQLIEKKQSQYYAIAGRWLTRMKNAYALQGQQAEWEAYLNGLRQNYARRPALQDVLRYL